MKLRDNLGSQFGREAAFRVGANMTRDGTATFGCAGRYRSRRAATDGGDAAGYTIRRTDRLGAQEFAFGDDGSFSGRIVFRLLR
jgi:hypothetical protein